MLDQLEVRKNMHAGIASLFMMFGMGLWAIWFFVKTKSGLEVMPTFDFTFRICEIIFSIIVFINASIAIRIVWKQVDIYLEESKMLPAFIQDPLSDMIQADEWREERSEFYTMIILCVANIAIIICMF